MTPSCVPYKVFAPLSRSLINVNRYAQPKHNILVVSVCLCWLLLVSCGSELRVVVPDVESLHVLENSTAVPRSSLALLDGVYLRRNGTTRFGDTIVVKHDASVVSMFCQRNSSYLVLSTGVRDTSLIMAGYWRFAQAAQTGLAVLRIEGSDALALKQNRRPANLSISGSIGGSENFGDERIDLVYLRPLHGQDSSSSRKEVLILAHRGGGRNSDRLPYSENSVELIRYASRLGAQGVEIDVRLTKDGIPVLYHDENLNTRLVDGEYMVGPIGNYTLAQLHALCRLKNGEQIPTLQKVLDDIVDSTSLRAVWLDIKDAAEVHTVVSMQKVALQRAASLHALGQRDTLEIFFGLATDEIYQTFLKEADFNSVSSVCELGLEQTRKAGSRVYGARWTLGALDNELAQLHAEQRKAFVWTLDQPEFIQSFLDHSSFDGILTNYPTVVAYNKYVRP